MAIRSMKELMIEELREIYHAERLALRAYPGLRKALKTPSLRDAVERHMEQTKEQVERLGQIFEMMDARTRGKTSHAMQGLIEEAQEHIDADLPPELLEVMLVADLQKMEHFEIAAYGSAKAHAEALGLQQAADLLEETLNEEKQTDTLLNQIAMEEINQQAVGASDENKQVIQSKAEKSPKKDAPRKSAATASKSRDNQSVQPSQSKGGPPARVARGAKGNTGRPARSGSASRTGSSN
jgi:ferritin-like metal-binding protein YciE